MPSLRTNIIANYAGQIWTAVMMVAFIPLYLDILGAEAYGLVGILLSLQAISQLFDFGVGGAVNREIARRSASPEHQQTLPSLVRTFELILWVMSIATGFALFFSSEFLASNWLNASSMPHDQVVHGIGLIGIIVTVLWPGNFYINCLCGLQQLPFLNLVMVIFATLRSVGVLPVLFWVSSSISAFLWWNLLIGTLQSLFLAVALWKKLPHSKTSAHFAPVEFSILGKFAGGLFLSSLSGLILIQLDRLLLVGLRPLSEVGYYTIAISVTAAINRMIQPMFNAIYPRFSQLVFERNEVILAELYHQSSQLIAVLVSSVAAVIIVFAEPILMLWLNDQYVVSQIRNVVVILVAGSALYGFFTLPYALQLANGWTKLSIVVNFTCLLAGVPLCFLAITYYGYLGAAAFTSALNVIWVFIVVPLMHRKLLVGHCLRWLFVDSLPPALCAIAVALACKFWLPPVGRSFFGAILLILIGCIVLFFTSLAVKVTRTRINKKIQYLLKYINKPFIL